MAQNSPIKIQKISGIDAVNSYVVQIRWFYILESCDKLPTSLVYIDTCTNPHKILGHVQVLKFDDRKDSVEFDLVEVDKDLQRKGVGKNMMLDAEKWAKVKRFNAAYLCSVSSAEDFYKKCGYSEVKSGAYEGMFKKEI